MQRMETSVCAGCWRPTTPLLLLLLLLPCVLAVHGNAVGTNATDVDGAANVTSLLNEDEGPAKADEAVAAVTAAVTGTSPSSDPVSAVTPRAGRIPRAGGEEEEEHSSGMFGEVAVRPAEEAGVSAPPQLSPDSAETDHLLPGEPRQDAAEAAEEGEEPEEEEEAERLPHTDPPWIHAKDTAVFDLDRLFTTTAAAAAAAQPSSPSNPDVLHVDFFDPASRGRDLDLAPPSPSSLAHELQGGDATSWAMPENYDYLTPYEDGVSPTADEYAYSTTTDAYETDEDLRPAAGSPARSRPRGPSPGSFVPGAALPGAGAPVPDVPAAAPPALPPGACRPGFQMINGSCRSPCDMQPNYCFNGGQCYLMDANELYCRCNVQDYIWHKGARCESVVTEFQVLCLAVGASALVVLLLFMIVVCFAKKLHVLKTENKKLRKRSKYRPSSEQHNDNFSLSTIAEGSHPNVRKLCDTPPNVPHARALAYYDNIICQDDPNSQNKLEDPVKAPPKEDDSLNIHNSLTPKHENHKVLGEENSSEVNSLQNNMM
ncbi:unnamed protein product [Ophioblennius macclurei]